MTDSEREVFHEALALLDKAAKRSKGEGDFYRAVKPGFEKLEQEGKVMVLPGVKDRFLTMGEKTRLSATLMAPENGSKEAHHSAVVVTAILLAHEWAHNRRGGRQTTEVPVREGQAYPYLSGVEMGRLIKDMYREDMSRCKPEDRAAIEQKIATVDFWIQAHIDGGRSEGVNINYSSRDIRHHKP